MHTARRYCTAVIDSCFHTADSAYEECLNGPVETVVDDSDSYRRRYFKIRLVHYVIATSGETTQSRKRSALVCPSLGRRGPFKSFSCMFIVYKQFSSESTVNETVRAHCPEGLVVLGCQ